MNVRGLGLGDIVGIRQPGSVFDGCAAVVLAIWDDGADSGAWLAAHTQQTDYPLRGTFSADEIVPWDEVLHGSGRPPGVPPTVDAPGNPLAGRRLA